MTRFLGMKTMIAVLFLAAIQSACALFFILELVTEVFGLRQWALPWEWREILQVAASLGLLMGSFASIALCAVVWRRINRVRRQIRAASGSFFGVMEECFDEWDLSPSERDVAIFAVRGLTNAEIAELRGTSLPTVKSQISAVFRKAGVTSRAHLLSQFIDVLIAAEPREAGGQDRLSPGLAEAADAGEYRPAELTASGQPQ